MEPKNQKQINKQTPNKLMGTENRFTVTRGDAGWEVSKRANGGQLYGDRWQLDFWKSSHYSVPRCQVIRYS